MAYLLGVDIGTSGTKTVLFDEAGNTIASALEEYPLYQPNVGWAEQDPEDWWRATYKSINQVIAKSGIDASEIKGVGLSDKCMVLFCWIRIQMYKKGNNLVRPEKLFRM